MPSQKKQYRQPRLLTDVHQELGKQMLKDNKIKNNSSTRKPKKRSRRVGWRTVNNIETDQAVIHDFIVRDKREKMNRLHNARDVIEEDECDDDELNRIYHHSEKTEPKSSNTVSFTLQRSTSRLEEKKRRKAEEEKRANVMVTSGALIFLLVAAALVTASFLMSPVIENMFSK